MKEVHNSMVQLINTGHMWKKNWKLLIY